MQVSINGKDIECKDGETILEVARREEIYIPTLCELADIDHHPGTCRVCLVEVLNKGADKPIIVTSCTTPVRDGMSILTRSPKVKELQKMQAELLFADHDQDCSTCSRHGNCELQDVAHFVGLTENRFKTDNRISKTRPADVNSKAPSMSRDMSKCIRCFRCVEMCRKVQGVDALFIKGMGINAHVDLRNGDTQPESDCVTCGQCIMVCPTGALSERNDVDKVQEYLADPEIKTVFQFAPAIRVGFGEEFGVPEATNVEGLIISALRKIGGDIILDTNFAADLVIMEEGTELLHRLKEGKRPMFTSCCPAWINFAEKHYPEILPNVSTTKSPQNCLGALAKTYLPEKMGLDASKIKVISIMPCVAKKDEAIRPQLTINGLEPEIDVVLTIREFADLMHREGISFKDLEPGTFDNPYMTDYSGAGAIFGATGGVMEAALRTVYYVLNGKELDGIDIQPVRGMEDTRAATVDVGAGIGEVKVAVCHGLKAARQMVEKVLAGDADYDFIEIMSCPSGCINGGGHLRAKKHYRNNAEKRIKSLYNIDRTNKVRQSHNNPQIKALYENYLGTPNSDKAHHLLHTHFKDRTVVYHQTMQDIWKEVAETVIK